MIQHSYLPNTEAQRAEMLRAIGVGSVEELFSDIPVQFRNPTLDLPPALPELELLQELASLAGENLTPGDYACFLGGGVYRHFVPSIVGAMVSRGELLTSYTPYQPEVSQGTLQATYDFQTLICLLTGMEVANAGMYDGATALAEAALMACRVTDRSKVAVLDTVNPRYREVVASYTAPQGIQVITVSSEQPGVDQETACLLAQYPTFLGAVPDLGACEKVAHSEEALLVVSAYPTALGMFKPPGEYGADIVTGESQPLGVALSYGGPYVGFFACRQRFLRQMPGRIVGRTVDTRGRPGYVLTLQTREQHIRREGATSNICTSEALIATATAVYMAALGPRGLRQVAELCYQKAHYAASLIAQIPGYAILPGGRAVEEGPDGSRAQPWFNEFVAQCPVPPSELNRRLRDHHILGGLDVSDQVPGGMLFCVTETNSRREIEALAAVLAEVRE